MRIFFIHQIAKVLGILVHIDGLPFGRRGAQGVPQDQG